LAELGLTELEIIINRHNRDGGQLIPILQEVQRLHGYLSEADMRQIADALNIPVSKVFGVATFYSLFATTPKGKHLIRLCESAPCHIRGAEEICGTLQKELGVAPGETTADGLFTLEYTSCLGVCGVAPVMMIDAVVYGNLTAGKVKEVLASYRQAAAAAAR